MALTGGLTIEFRDRAPEACRFDFDDAAERQLKGFLAEALRLESALRDMGGLPVTYRVRFQQGEPVIFDGEEPSEAQRAVFLHRMRPFVLQNEPYEFNLIRGVVARGSTGEWLQDRLRQMKELYTGRHMRSQASIGVGDLIVNSEAALQHWLNGFEYHRDEERAQALVEAHGSLSIDASRPIFIMMLREKANAVLHLANLIHGMLAPAASAGDA